MEYFCLLGKRIICNLLKITGISNIIYLLFYNSWIGIKCVACICFYYYLNNNIIVIERCFIPAQTIDTSYPFRALPRWSCSCSGQTFRVADPTTSIYIYYLYIVHRIRVYFWQWVLSAPYSCELIDYYTVFKVCMCVYTYKYK